MTEHAKPSKAKNLIDLAGSERVKKSGAAGCCLRSSIEWDEKMKEMQEVSVKVFEMQSKGRVLFR